MFSLQNLEKSCSLLVKPGIPYPWTSYPTRPVRHLPYWTRTCGYGSGRVYPLVWVDQHTPSTQHTGCVYCTHSTLCVPKPFFSHPSDPVGHWYLLYPLSDRFVCDPVVICDPHNSLPAIFTGNKPIFYVFGESP